MCISNIVNFDDDNAWSLTPLKQKKAKHKVFYDVNYLEIKTTWNPINQIGQTLKLLFNLCKEEWAWSKLGN
jgi:exoribonuclease II